MTVNTSLVAKQHSPSHLIGLRLAMLRGYNWREGSHER
jgi:hypothetical protein